MTDTGPTRPPPARRAAERAEPRAAGRNTARWILPPAASIAVHAGLLIALAAVTIEVTREKPPPRPSRVTLAAPPVPADAPAPAAAAPTGDPAGTAGVPAPAEPAAITRAISDAARPGPGRAATPVQLAPAAVTDAILSPANASSPTVRFAEIDAAPARTVVFVVDASGAVATAFTFVREELLRSIDQLSPTQRFQVIVFPGPENTDPVTAPINSGRLALATPAAKRAVAEWMTGFRPRGQSRPLAGLREALAHQPDIVMLITRSIERTGPDAAWGASLHDTLAELDRLNPADRTGARRSAIAAVQLLDPDPTGIMPAIAARHGQGVSDYRVVTADMLASVRPEERGPGATGAKPSHTIDAAAAILAELDDTGASLRLFHGLPDDADRDRLDDRARRAADLAARTPDDARARVLLARARTLTSPPTDLDDAIRILADELLHDADADAWRRLALVDALVLAARPAEALAHLDALRADAAELPVSRPVRARIATTAAALGPDHEPADPDDALQRAPFTDEAGDTDPYWVLALTEARVRGRLRNPSAATDPFEPLVSLLERAERDGGAAWPPILADRIVRAAELARETDPDAVARAAPRVRLIVADAWSRSPATRAEARALLESLTVPESPLRPAALWRLALLERGSGSPSEAARLFTLLATEHPEDPNAADALAGAIALSEDPQALRPLLTRAVRTLPDRPEIDLWRLNLAGLLDGAERLDALEPIGTGTRESTLARESFAETAETVYGRVGEAERAALAARTAAFLARHDSPDAPRWLARAAEALTARDPVRAIELAEQSVTRARAIAQPTAHAELVLARAQLAARRTANALTTLQGLAARLDPQADAAHFWEAWTLLLETAGRSDPTTARAHLARLELLDPDLGGAPWSQRLRTLRAQLSTP